MTLVMQLSDVHRNWYKKLYEYFLGDQMIEDETNGIYGRMIEVD
ncbi:MAG: hypothetical protein H6Q18_1075 [Bacteroidetes bacterium]|nr:hypothetical protein [Bacteroidota bacterium]